MDGDDLNGCEIPFNEFNVNENVPSNTSKGKLIPNIFNIKNINLSDSDRDSSDYITLSTTMYTNSSSHYTAVNKTSDDQYSDFSSDTDDSDDYEELDFCQSYTQNKELDENLKVIDATFIDDLQKRNSEFVYYLKEAEKKFDEYLQMKFYSFEEDLQMRDDAFEKDLQTRKDAFEKDLQMRDDAFEKDLQMRNESFMKDLQLRKASVYKYLLLQELKMNVNIKTIKEEKEKFKEEKEKLKEEKEQIKKEKEEVIRMREICNERECIFIKTNKQLMQSVENMKSEIDSRNCNLAQLQISLENKEKLINNNILELQNERDILDNLEKKLSNDNINLLSDQRRYNDNVTQLKKDKKELEKRESEVSKKEKELLEKECKRKTLDTGTSVPSVFALPIIQIVDRIVSEEADDDYCELFATPRECINELNIQTQKLKEKYKELKERENICSEHEEKMENEKNYYNNYNKQLMERDRLLDDRLERVTRDIQHLNLRKNKNTIDLEKKEKELIDIGLQNDKKLNKIYIERIETRNFIVEKNELEYKLGEKQLELFKNELLHNARERILREKELDFNSREECIRDREECIRDIESAIQFSNIE